MIFYSILLVLTCFLFSLITFTQGAKKQQISNTLSWLIIAINCSSIYFFSIKFFLISVGITFITLWIVGFPARYLASKYWASRGSSIMPNDPDERMQWSMDLIEKARKKSEEIEKEKELSKEKDGELQFPKDDNDKIEYYNHGQVHKKWHGKYKDGKWSGDVEIYYPATDMQVETFGLRKEFFEHYENEKLAFVYEFYYKKQIKSRKRFNPKYKGKGNQKHGGWATFREDEKPIKDCTYSYGKLDGIWRVYDKDGNLKEEKFYDKGKRLKMSWETDNVKE